MNDVKIDIKDRTITFGDFIRFYDVPEYIINYINQLQSNWNILREWINTRIQANIIRTGMRSEDLLFVLDKMNELEGVSDE